MSVYLIRRGELHAQGIHTDVDFPSWPGLSGPSQKESR